MIKDLLAAFGLGSLIGYSTVILVFEFWKGVEFFKEKWKKHKKRSAKEEE